MNAAECLLKCLALNGIDTIYGVPGEENADVMMALPDSNIQFITCRHEQTASFMADMHGRITGKPGVCLSTLGPGVTNMITGIANANMDHAPLIAIIGQASTTRLHKESHQNMDSISMCKPISKWTITIRDPNNIPEIVAKACKVATTGKPGAVIIELPEDLASQAVTAKPIEPKPQHQSSANHHQAKAFMDLLSKAKKPLLLLGAGCIRESTSEVIESFMNHTGIYAAHTFMGKGVISAKHAQSLRCVGLGMKDIALQAFEQADCIICVGYDMVEWHPDRWNTGGQKTIVNIDVIPGEPDQFFTPDMELIGSISHTFKTINETLGSETQFSKDWVEPIRTAILADLNQYDEDDAFPMKPQKVLADIRSSLGVHDILVSDVGAHKMWVARHYPTYAPKTCFIHNGFCSMGGAMPGAVEAARLQPDVNVVAVCGDGGFLMSVQALSTAISCQTPIVVVVFDDNHFGLIQWKQEVAFEQSVHTELTNPDFVKLAESFGCHAVRIDSNQAFKTAFNDALQRKDKATVIVVPIDYQENLKLNRHLGDIISR